MGLTVKKMARLTKPGSYLDANDLYLQVLTPTDRSVNLLLGRLPIAAVDEPLVF